MVASPRCRGELLFDDLIESERRFTALNQKCLLHLPFGKLFGPDGAAPVVLILELGQTGQQRLNFLRALGKLKFMRCHIAFNDVRRRRKDVGEQVFALDYLGVIGARNLHFVHNPVANDQQDCKHDGHDDRHNTEFAFHRKI